MHTTINWIVVEKDPRSSLSFSCKKEIGKRKKLKSKCGIVNNSYRQEVISIIFG